MHGVKRGVFITFEGVEGSGKSTQVRLLFEWLRKKDVACMIVRDPGSTQISEAIRAILLNRNNKTMHKKCEVLLFLAARSQLVYEKIMPALISKQVIVCDRFFDSTIAYQVHGRDTPERLITIVNRFASAGLKPDLTFLIDCDVKIARLRGSFNDRMESEAIDYHETVRNAYLAIARRSKKRMKIINGEGSVDVISQEVTDHTHKFLLRKGFKL